MDGAGPLSYVGIVKEGIETVDLVLDLYDKEMDRLIPWDAFNETIVELDKFRKDYSAESAALIGDIKGLMMDGMDAYFVASQSVYEWTSLVQSLLTMYQLLFNGHDQNKAKAQKELLVRVLDDGFHRMTEAQGELVKCSASFNSAAGNLTALHSRFEVEFDEKSEFFKTKITQIRTGAYASGAWYGFVGLSIAVGMVEGKIIPQLKEKMAAIKQYYDDLKEKIVQAFKNIDDIKKILKTEVQRIGAIKVQAKDTQVFVNFDDQPELRDSIKGSIQKLIAHCDAYRQRHINKTNLM